MQRVEVGRNTRVVPTAQVHDERIDLHETQRPLLHGARNLLRARESLTIDYRIAFERAIEPLIEMHPGIAKLAIGQRRVLGNPELLAQRGGAIGAGVMLPFVYRKEQQ